MGFEVNKKAFNFVHKHWTGRYKKHLQVGGLTNEVMRDFEVRISSVRILVFEGSE